jgi:uncharacterized membrane protein
MATRDTFEIDDVVYIDYSQWLQRVIGWDAILPFLIWIGSIVIASAFHHRPPADIIALGGLPVAGFLIRWSFGYRHIKSNACGNVLRGFQSLALFCGLVALIIVDFFHALSVFIANGNPLPDGVIIICVIAYLVYLMLAIFAMYPGRVRKLQWT